jgi:quercetin dioxygenase-like cupin family protein
MRALALLAMLALQGVPGEADASSVESARLKRVVLAHMPDVDRCYAEQASGARGGELLLRVTLGEREKVERSEILKDELGLPKVARCIEDKMQRWSLEGLGAQAGTEVVFPLVFKAQPEVRHAVALSDVQPVPPPKAAPPGKPAPVPPLATFPLLDETSVGATAAAMTVVQVGPKSKLAMHKHPVADEVLYVLEGHGRLLAPGMEPQKLDPGMAVFVSKNAPHSIDDQSAQKALRLLQVFVPPGPERALRDRSQAGGTEVIRGTPQPVIGAAYDIVHEADSKALPILGGKASAHPLLPGALDPKSTRSAYLGVLEAPAGTNIPQHAHKGSAELLFVISGKGTSKVAGADVAVEAGTAIYIPADAPHEAHVSEALRAVQLYVPPGPESRFAAPAPGEAKPR